MNFADYYIAFGTHWAIDAAVLLLIVFVLAVNWRRFVKFSVSQMLLLALLIWLCGLGLYTVGFAYEGSGHNLTTVLLRSSIASLKMFIADNELVEVSAHYKEDAIYMAMFAIVHFLAFVLATILVLNTLGARIRSYFQLVREAATCRKNAKHSYVFWDVNSPSVALAKDIKENEKDARIIFICPFGTNSLGEKLEITQILNSTAMSEMHESSDVEDLDSDLTVFVHDTVRRSKRTSMLKRILEYSSDVDFFFLTEDVENNLVLASTLARGNQLRPSNGYPAGIHVMTNDSSHQIVGEELLMLHEIETKNIRWSFVDIPTLAVESLKYRKENFPVYTFPEESVSEAKVNAGFKSWILGLGDTGNRMFKFLYEFSMLENNASDVISREFTLFDKNIGQLAGYLLKDCPELASSPCVNISDLKLGSLEFWNMLRDNANDLNCISIALGNDELDLKLTRSIYRHLVHYSTSPKVHTKLFVRVYTPGYAEVFKALAAEYRGSNVEIVPFGLETDIFKSALIMKDTVMKAFKAFNHRFDMVRGKNSGMSAEECWKADFDINKYTSAYDDVTVALDELERRKEQCMSSTFFINTLLKLAGIKETELDKMESLIASLDKYDGSSDSLVDVLIRACYLREKASHQLLGFVPCSNEFVKADRKAAVTHKMTHYLLAWEEIPENVKMMFRDVLKTSLQIAIEYQSALYGKKASS